MIIRRKRTFAPVVPEDPRFQCGLVDYSKVVGAEYFVDKTPLIKELLTSGGNPIKLITAPGGFGKSTNMAMVKAFCEIKADSSGRPRDGPTANYRLFADNDLHVYKDTDFFHDHFGKYPVVYVSLKYTLGGTFFSFLERFRYVIHTTYTEFDYLMFSKKLTESDKRMFFAHFRYTTREPHLKITKLVATLQILSRALFLHFGKRALLLIDEYDAPLHYAICQPAKDFNQICRFVRTFLYHSVTDNPYAHMAVISGCVRIENIFPTRFLNKRYKHISFPADQRFFKFYGLIDSEVQTLLETRDACTVKLRKWYGGYAPTQNSTTEQFYKIGSAVKYLETKRVRTYWTDILGVAYLKEACFHDDVRAVVADLLKRRAVAIYNDHTFNMANLIKLSEMKDRGPQATHGHDTGHVEASLLFQYLTEIGYFIYSEFDNRKKVDNLRLNKEDLPKTLKTLSLSNLAARSVLINRIYTKKLLKDVFAFKKNPKALLVYSLLSLDESDQKFRKVLEFTFHLFNDINTFPVDEYEFRIAVESVIAHALPLFKAVRLDVTYISTIKKSSNQKIDLILIRNDGTSIIMQFRLKRSQGEKPKPPSAGQTLRQIINHNYLDILDTIHADINEREFVMKNNISIGMWVNGKKLSLCYLHNSRNIEDETCMSIDDKLDFRIFTFLYQ